MSTAGGIIILLSHQTEEDNRLNEIEDKTNIPEINYFKSAYIPYVDFATSLTRLEFKNKCDWGNKVRVVLTDDGSVADMISKTYLVVTLPALTYTNNNGVTLPFTSTEGGYTNSIGQALIEYIELEINNKIVDKIYGVWLNIWNIITNPNLRDTYNEMVGTSVTDAAALGNAQFQNTYIIPLGTWFSNDYNQAIPMVALYNSSIAINIKLRSFTEMYVLAVGNTIAPNITPIVEGFFLYEGIYFDNKYRDVIRHKRYEFIVDTISYNNGEEIHPNILNMKLHLPFNNPSKGIYLVIQEKAAIAANQYFVYNRRDQTGKFTLNVTEQRFIKNMKITHNGTEMVPQLPETVYRLQQNYIRQTNSLTKNIYSYIWALKPTEYRRSGDFNFNITDTTKLFIEVELNSLPRRITLNPVTGQVVTDVTYDSTPLIAQIFSITSNVFIVEKGVGYLEFTH